MKTQATGRIVDIQPYTKGTFTKKTVVLIVDEHTDYPQYLPIEYAGQKADLVQMYGAGDKITCEFEAQGRKWEKDGETRYFPSFRGIEAYNSELKQQAPKAQQVQHNVEVGSNPDDLPF